MIYVLINKQRQINHEIKEAKKKLTINTFRLTSFLYILKTKNTAFEILIVDDEFPNHFIFFNKLVGLIKNIWRKTRNNLR